MMSEERKEDIPFREMSKEVYRKMLDERKEYKIIKLNME